MVSFYKTKVVVNQQRAKVLQLLTMQHGYDETAYSIWKAERQLRITSSIAGQYHWQTSTNNTSRNLHMHHAVLEVLQ